MLENSKETNRWHHKYRCVQQTHLKPHHENKKTKRQKASHSLDSNITIFLFAFKTSI